MCVCVCVCVCVCIVYSNLVINHEFSFYMNFSLACLQVYLYQGPNIKEFIQRFNPERFRSYSMLVFREIVSIVCLHLVWVGYLFYWVVL